MSTQQRTTKDILLLIPLSALSFADPITDILTLMEYYSAGHKNWFIVGLLFMITPFPAFWAFFYGTSKNSDARCAYDMMCLCGCHPFTVAFYRLEAFVVCGIKKFWKGEEIVKGQYEYDVLKATEQSASFEALFESAPQLVIQLYVVSVQIEPVNTIQIISLPVSFLSLVWAFQEEIPNKPMKYKILDFLTKFFLLSTRLLAITYFVVGFTWLLIAILVFHFISLRIMHCIWPYANAVKTCTCTCENVLFWWFFFGSSWIGYEPFDEEGLETETARKHLRLIHFLSYCVIVLENVIMILLYYVDFGAPYKTFREWYSLPVTVYVCLFSIITFVLRFMFVHYFLLNDNYVHPE
ncbi:XK-related protein 6-like [Actinia tenebrosa]|uniref:XK-related protein n=1 Tax=Actinia tenebrosa TaxID=6105 RepID=A0A6P8I0S6_ACTTE|nr:XK-related protein 6-like [Actinia tenebrosa]